MFTRKSFSDVINYVVHIFCVSKFFQKVITRTRKNHLDKIKRLFQTSPVRVRNKTLTVVISPVDYELLLLDSRSLYVPKI